MTQRTPKIIKASKSLQFKAGTGDIPLERIEEAENVILNNDEDFLPLAETYLSRLKESITKARSGGDTKQRLTSEMIKPVMELKGNSRMFHYSLVTTLANIMLDFLENIEKLDNTALDIVEAHHKTLTIIFTQKLSGDGGEAGTRFQKELMSACARYYAQQKV